MPALLHAFKENFAVQKIQTSSEQTVPRLGYIKNIKQKFINSFAAKIYINSLLN